MLTDWIYRDLQKSAVFDAVVMTPSTMPATHILEGTVEAFYAQNKGGNWAAVLTISLALLALEDNRIEFQGQFDTTVPMAALSPDIFAQAMSAGMQTLSAQIIDTLYTRLR